MPDLTFHELRDLLVTRVGLSPDSVGESPDTTFADMGLDSLGLVELQLAIAQRYGLERSSDVTDQSVTARQVIAHTNERLQERTLVGGQTDNSIMIEAPVQLVWDITNDVEDWPNLFTEYSNVTVLERDGTSIVFRLTMHPDENGKVWSWVSRRTLDRNNLTVRTHRVETGAFEYMNIEWQYVPGPQGTLMRWIQNFHMKADAPLTDEQMTQRINTNTPIQMRIIKEKIERRAAAG